FRLARYIERLQDSLSHRRRSAAEAPGPAPGTRSTGEADERPRYLMAVPNFRRVDIPRHCLNSGAKTASASSGHSTTRRTFIDWRKAKRLPLPLPQERKRAQGRSGARGAPRRAAPNPTEGRTISSTVIVFRRVAPAEAAQSSRRNAQIEASGWPLS